MCHQRLWLLLGLCFSGTAVPSPVIYQGFLEYLWQRVSNAFEMADGVLYDGRFKSDACHGTIQLQHESLMIALRKNTTIDCDEDEDEDEPEEEDEDEDEDWKYVNTECRMLTPLRRSPDCSVIPNRPQAPVRKNQIEVSATEQVPRSHATLL
jgi:hypothetical protein